MKYIILLLILISFNVSAIDLVRGVMTRHTLQSDYIYNDNTYQFNEQNDLIGVEVNSKLVVATMKNSYYKRAVIAMYTPFNHQYLDLKVGVSTGYDHMLPEFSVGGLTPAFSFGVKYKNLNVSLFALSAVVVSYRVSAY